MPEGYKNFSKTRPMLQEHFKPALDWWNDRREIVENGFDKARCYSATELAAGGYNLDLCGYPHEGDEEILPPLELINEYQQKRLELNAKIDGLLADIIGQLPRDSKLP